MFVSLHVDHPDVCISAVWREDTLSLTLLFTVSSSNYICFSAAPLRPIIATALLLLVGSSLAALLQPEAPVAAPLAITPQERENTHTCT